MKLVWLLPTIFVLTACVENAGYNKTPIYRDLTNKGRGDGELAMSQAYCRNMVNSYNPEPYNNQGAYYSTGSGQALGNAINRVQRGMSGPSYADCMVSQGFGLVGYE